MSDKQNKTRPVANKGRGGAGTQSATSKKVIKKIDITNLHDSNISDVMLHCAAALKLRSSLNSADASLADHSPSYCYTKSGDDQTVSIWSGGFKVGETSEANAQASGIPPCG